MTNYLQPLSNNRRKVRASDPRRAFRGLPSEPIGLVYGNTTRIDPGMNNVYRHNLLTGQPKNAKDVGRSTAPWSAHTTTGEDASRTTSQHWAISQEPVSERRTRTERFMVERPELARGDYRRARNYVIAQELAEQRASIKKQRKSANRADRADRALANKLLGKV